MMKRKLRIDFRFIILFLLLHFLMRPAVAGQTGNARELDEKVKGFLASQRGQWVDWNIPAADGRILYDLIIKNNYQKAVEIGTSTGHSAIWMAWALSKTGGKLITIEIDEGRYRKALAIQIAEWPVDVPISTAFW